ncbi:MAG: hypothetical protein LBM25_01225 [Bacteroidales bacterium]|jgi:lipopolysaccharide export system protein LptA|nr:hypothetical protein [Bacteroidales bacterium]
MPIKIILISLLLTLTFSQNIFSQKKINYSASLGEMLPNYPDQMILLDSVVFQHEGMTMFCDSALFNEKENRFSAFGNVHIIQKDTLDIWGDELYYEGQTKIAELFGKKVVMKDKNITLNTTYLILERVPNTISYTQWADIFDEKSTLRSRKATYYMSNKDIVFTDKVDINSENTLVKSDTMIYNTESDIATFYGPTNILTKDSTLIYTEKGWYNTKTEESYSYKESQMLKKERLLQADTLTYNSTTLLGEGFSNIYFEDTAKHIVLTGNRMFVNNIDSSTYVFITNKTLMKHISDSDTLFLHSDTIWVDYDTAMNIKNIYSYNDVKFFRDDFQGACDSLLFFTEDSLLYMLGRPILWSEENQITADTIIMNVGDNAIYSLDVFPKAFVIQDADTTQENERFNQIFGKRMKAFFDRNKLYLIEVYGNAQSVYYIFEEEKDKPIQLLGINVGSGSEMKIYVKKNKIQKITTLNDPVFFTDDEEKVSKEEKILKGFIWRIEERPLKKEDIFIKR